MAKTSSDVVNILYLIIKQSVLVIGDSKALGGLYKGKRPIDSISEDIVINSLPMNYEQLQEGLINVNVYVPNIEIKVADKIDRSQPNTARLTELEAVACALFTDINAPDGSYSFNLQQSNIFEDINNQHYINLRIEFYSINI